MANCSNMPVYCWHSLTLCVVLCSVETLLEWLTCRGWSSADSKQRWFDCTSGWLSYSRSVYV